MTTLAGNAQERTKSGDDFTPRPNYSFFLKPLIDKGLEAKNKNTDFTYFDREALIECGFRQ